MKTERLPAHASSIGASTLSRRALMEALAAFAVAGCASQPDTRAQRAPYTEFKNRAAELQATVGGRIGVYVLDTGSRRELSFNARERFAMCSTFKILLAAAVLDEVEAGRLSLEQQVKYGPEDMISHAPVTSQHLAAGSLSVRQLCAAAVEVSDNPAANLLLALIAGPAALTRYLRRTGDLTTRLDRTEPELNTNLPRDPRDTTTPRAMVRTLEELLLGRALSPDSRALLINWLRNSRTGMQRVRAGLPADWRVGDKTGTGANGAVNDVVIAWPPNSAPLIAAVYMSESTEPRPVLEDVQARIGALIAQSAWRKS